MAEQERKTWLRRRVEDGLRRGFQRAYETVKVDPVEVSAAGAGRLRPADHQLSGRLFAWRSASSMTWRTA